MYAKFRLPRLPGRGRVVFGWGLLLLLLGVVANATAYGLDRHANWVKKFAKGPKAELVTATFFGTKMYEEATGVVSLPDGRIVLYGNSWGPPFPATPAPTVLGTDALYDVPLNLPGMERDKKGRLLPPSRKSPNRTGFMVIYDETLSKILEVRRFGWGVASISAGKQMSDNSLVIAGSCTPNFRTWATGATTVKVVSRDDGNAKMGPIEFGRVTVPGDTYVAKLGSDLTTVEWIVLFEGHNRVPTAIHEGVDGEVVIDCYGIKRISKDGATVTPVTRKGTIKLGGSLQWRFLTVNPTDGTMLYGGDHQSGTGQEPWRKPILIAYTREGELKYRLYDWDGPVVGHSRYRLVSDSSVRFASYNLQGELSLYIWSDGGNSVATRNPIDLDKPVDSRGIGMDMWGASVGSFCHFVKFDPETREKVWYSLFCSYTAQKPNSLTCDGILALSTGETAIWGASASFLVQTPNAFYTCEKEGGGRGNFITIFNSSFSNALFSSALAMCDTVAAAEGTKGVVYASTCKGAQEENEFKNRPPTKNALQDTFAGGGGDAHLLLMRLPQTEGGTP